MKTRRSFLSVMATLTLAQMLSACGDDDADLRVSFLQNSLPPGLIDDFKKKFGKSAAFKQLAQIKDIKQLLDKKPEKEQQQWRIPFISSNPKVVDILSMSDYYLSEYIAQKTIQPLDVETISNWQKVPKKFQQLVRRSATGMSDPQGLVWAAPYRWGVTAIAYDKEKLKSAGIKAPEDWSDLWRDEYRDKLALLDQPREIIGLTLKSLGYSYNTKELDQVKDLKNTLARLQKNVKFYSSTDYLQSLAFGDCSVAVGWSNELLSLQNSYPKIGIVVPKSGTSLWSDLWVKSSLSHTSNNLINQWIDFCWQSKPANKISLFTWGSSPMIYSYEQNELAKDVKDNPLININPDIFDKSEFILPLPAETLKLYDAFWRDMRKK